MRSTLLTGALILCVLGTPASGQKTDISPSPASGTDSSEVSAATARRQLLVEQVELSGKPRTQRVVVERYLGLTAGAPLRPEDLLTGRQRLEETGFYKSVDVYARPGSEKGLVVVVVELDEHVQPQYRFEGGHGELDGWYIVPIGFVYDNPWGRGHRLDWKWILGGHGSASRLHYQHPRLFAGAATLDLNWFSETRAYPQWRRDQQISENVSAHGVSLRVAGLSGRFRHLFTEIRTQRYSPEADTLLAPLLGSDMRRARVTTVDIGWQQDTRDHRMFPTTGFWGQAALHQALGGRLGDRVFTRLDLEGRWYRPLAGSKVAAVRGRAGLASEGAPFYERYYLGGPYSHRRFERAEATPLGWGTRTVQIQSELRLPFGHRDQMGPRHTAVLFYDLGGIWRPGEVPVPTDLEHTMGVGYRRSLRVLGVLRLDMSLPLIPSDGESKWEAFHLWLTLGQAF